MNGARYSFQMTLHSPSMELSNISFHGSWTMTKNFSQNTSRVSHLPPVFYICSEDFKPLGIQAPLFGAVCFVLVYAIPGKTTWLITNWTYISIPFPFPFWKRKTKWYDSVLLSLWKGSNHFAHACFLQPLWFSFVWLFLFFRFRRNTILLDDGSNTVRPKTTFRLW